MENSSSSLSGDDYKANNNIGGDNTAPLRRRAHSFMTNKDEDIPQRKREHTILASGGGGDVMGGEEDSQLSPQQLLPTSLSTSLSTPPSLQSRIPRIISRHSLSTTSHERRRRQRQQPSTCPHHHHNYTSTTLLSTLYHEEEGEGEGGREGNSSSSCDMESGIRLLNFDNIQLPPDSSLLLSSSSSSLLGDQQRHNNIVMVGRAENSSSLSSLSSPNDSIIDFSDSSSTQSIETNTGRAATAASRSDYLVLSTTSTPLLSSYHYLLLNNPTNTIRHVVQNLQQRLECLGLIKLCMIISLFALLDIAWVSDLRYKYHSADVNFVLGEYWYGGISNRIGASPGGEIFIDDVAVDDVGGGSILNLGSHTTTSLNTTITTNTILSSLAVSGAVGGNKERTTLIPPSLSYARSSTSSSLYYHGSMKRATRPSLSKSTYSAGREEQTPTSTMAWSLWQAIRAIIWLVFALPVIETAVRKIRRRRCISALSTRRNNNSVMSR